MRWIMNTGPDGGNKLNPRTLHITKVFEWLDGRIIASKPGGIITVMLIGHGSPDGVSLGGQILNPAELTSRCSCFPADVQINYQGVLFGGLRQSF
jgi:hypothetical protein